MLSNQLLLPDSTLQGSGRGGGGNYCCQILACGGVVVVAVEGGGFNRPKILGTK